MRDDYRVDLQDPGERGSVCPILVTLNRSPVNDRFGPPRTSSTAGRIRSSVGGSREAVPAGTWFKSNFLPASASSWVECGIATPSTNGWQRWNQERRLYGVLLTSPRLCIIDDRSSVESEGLLIPVCGTRIANSTVSLASDAVLQRWQYVTCAVMKEPSDSAPNSSFCSCRARRHDPPGGGPLLEVVAADGSGHQVGELVWCACE